MAGITTLHRQALSATRRTIAGVARTQWTAPTPCSGWDVRQLVNHIVVGNWWAAALATGGTIEQVGTTLDGDQLGALPLDAYDQSAEASATAFEAPGALDAPCAVSYGPVPGSVYAGHRFVDVLVHGWDVAVATGQDPALSPALVDACWAEVEPQAAMLRASGMFGEGVVITGDADTQTRLLALLGRHA